MGAVMEIKSGTKIYITSKFSYQLEPSGEELDVLEVDEEKGLIICDYGFELSINNQTSIYDD